MLLVLISLKIVMKQLRNNNVISANKIVFADVLMLLKNPQILDVQPLRRRSRVDDVHRRAAVPALFRLVLPPKSKATPGMAYLSTVQSGMEFVMMMFIPWLVNHYGAKRGLLFCGCVVGAADCLRLDQRPDCHLHYQTFTALRSRCC